MNSLQVAAALRVLANAFEAEETEGGVAPTETAAPVKRGRGRPVKGEETAAPAAAVAPASAPQPTVAAVTPEIDPFDSKPAVPAATLEQVREALTILRAATSQDNALAVLKKWAANLTDLKPENYGEVVAAATAALPPVKTEAPVETPDPFATAPAEPVKAYTLEDIKAAAVDAQKRTSQDTVQKVVMKHGGVSNVAGAPPGVSLKALPVENYAAVIAELKALPTTK